LTKGTDISIANGSFTTSLPAQSVTTFVLAYENAPVSSSSSSLASSSSSEPTPSSSSSEPTLSSSSSKPTLSSSSSEPTPSSSSSEPMLSSSSYDAEVSAIAKVQSLTNSPALVEIYNLKGHKVDMKSPLPKGVYIAKVRGMQSKIFVVK
jgi:hypothetical protein